jgi:hypothetical protein
MSTVSVMTPIIVAAFPVLMQAVSGVAASMGFALVVEESDTNADANADGLSTTKVSTKLESSILGEQIGRNKKIVVSRGTTRIEFQVDARGTCVVCASSPTMSKMELEQLTKSVVGRVTQQYVYHKLVTELKGKNFNITQESVAADKSIHVQVSLNR